MFNKFWKFEAGIFLIFTFLVLLIGSCVTVMQPIPPIPDELKHIQVVNGWPVTRELEVSCRSVRMEKVSRRDDWWATHRRAVELKSDVVQFVSECYGQCDVRFWSCGKSFLPDGKKEAVKIYGDFIGTVSEVKGKDIAITGKNINEKAPMGSIFAVDAGAGMVYIEVTFPMMTVARCRVIKGSAADIRSGMKVYKKPKKGKT